jgi:hypothetical protein
VHHGKTKARALADAVRGEKRLYGTGAKISRVASARRS